MASKCRKQSQICLPLLFSTFEPLAVDGKISIKWNKRFFSPLYVSHPIYKVFIDSLQQIIVPTDKWTKVRYITNFQQLFLYSELRDPSGSKNWCTAFLIFWFNRDTTLNFVSFHVCILASSIWLVWQRFMKNVKGSSQQWSELKKMCIHSTIFLIQKEHRGPRWYSS